MATLRLPDENIQLEDAAEIRAFLDGHGILFEQWRASVPLALEATQEEILAAYRDRLDPYMKARGYQTADVINVNETTPNVEALREKFLREHTHTEDEVRFFVEGEGHFWFNVPSKENADEEVVFCVTCRAGDLLAVPTGYKHWFDLGPKPFVKVIRVFTDPAGWVANYTDSGVDARYNGMTAEAAS